MYTGIILHQGIIAEVIDHTDGGKRLRIDALTILDRIVEGSSVNVSGVCLTAMMIDDVGFFVDVMPQTLKLTTVGSWSVGDEVNIEPSLRVGDELGGHYVYGHVDGVAEIVEMEKEGNALVVMLRLSADLIPFVVPQGSVALDGISLTVVDVEENVFAVSLIPETVERTTWKDRDVGDLVNFEADMMIKYLKKVMKS